MIKIILQEDEIEKEKATELRILYIIIGAMYHRTPSTHFTRFFPSNDRNSGIFKFN